MQGSCPYLRSSLQPFAVCLFEEDLADRFGVQIHCVQNNYSLRGWIFYTSSFSKFPCGHLDLKFSSICQFVFIGILSFYMDNSATELSTNYNTPPNKEYMYTGGVHKYYLTLCSLSRCQDYTGIKKKAKEHQLSWHTLLCDGRCMKFLIASLDTSTSNSSHGKENIKVPTRKM